MSTKFVYVLLTLVIVYRVSCMSSRPSLMQLKAEPTVSFDKRALSDLLMSAPAFGVLGEDTVYLSDSVNLGVMESDLQDLAVDVMLFHIDQVDLRECFDEID